MKITAELNLTNFDFWSGAKDHKFTRSELEEIEFQMQDLFPDGATDTQINDMFWFEEEMLCEWIGIDYENDYLER